MSGQDPFCGSCENLTENCAECTSAQCLRCYGNMVVDADDSYKCKECSDLFFGCSECDSTKCKACNNSNWLLTDNGCAFEEEIPEELALNSSSFSPSSHAGPSQQAVAASSSQKNDNSNAGMIAGIVVGVVVVAAIAAVAIYCVVTSGPKHGKLDPSISDGDVEFVSMSVL